MVFSTQVTINDKTDLGTLAIQLQGLLIVFTSDTVEGWPWSLQEISKRDLDRCWIGRKLNESFFTTFIDLRLTEEPSYAQIEIYKRRLGNVLIDWEWNKLIEEFKTLDDSLQAIE